MASNGRWSTLIEPSTKSDDTCQVIACRPQKSAFGDRLRGLFCIDVLKSQQPKMRKKHVQPMTFSKPENDLNPSLWPSPWILPVNVVSNRQDADKRPIIKIAKCTLDTGNMQGNIISREFVENVLELPASSFENLSKEEERGGTGITGASHIPQGVVHLTWYHKSSTRVFRDMRFLISATSHCDLIIGARSIQKENILSVPCLMVDSRPGITLPRPGGHSDEAKMELQNALTRYESELKTYVNQRNEFEKGGKKDTRNKLPGIKAKIIPLQEKVDILTWTIEVYDIVHYPFKEGMSPAEKRDLADPVWEKIEVKFVSDDLKSPPLNLPEKWKTLRTELEYNVVTIPSTGSSYATGSAA